MFEKVLVCLDGSPLAEEILPYITEEGRHFSKVVFIRVLDAPVVDVGVGIPGGELAPFQTGKMLKDFKKALGDAPRYLERKAKPLTDKGVDVEFVVQEGAPGPLILQYAQDNGVTMIAMAMHGHSGFREVLGSTAEFVLKHAGLPVLMMTPKHKMKRGEED